MKLQYIYTEQIDPFLGHFKRKECTAILGVNAIKRLLPMRKNGKTVNYYNIYSIYLCLFILFIIIHFLLAFIYIQDCIYYYSKVCYVTLRK